MHPNKPIEHCMVIAHPSISSGYSLPTALLIPDKPEYVHDTKIPIGGGANFRFPKSIISPGLMIIVVRDNDKVLLTRSFGDIPETTP